MGQLRERRVVGNLVAANMILVAQGPGLNPRQPAGRENHRAVLIGFPYLHTDRGGLDADDIFKEASAYGLGKLHQSALLVLRGILIDNQNRPCREGIVKRIPQSRAGFGNGYD